MEEKPRFRMTENFLGNHMILNAVCNLSEISLQPSEFLKVAPRLSSLLGNLRKSWSDLRILSSAIFRIPFIIQLCVHVINSDDYPYKSNFHCPGIFMFNYIMTLPNIAVVQAI